MWQNRLHSVYTLKHKPRMFKGLFMKPKKGTSGMSHGLCVYQMTQHLKKI